MTLDLDITIAIPTYNGADRLPELFSHLQQQLVPTDITWDVLVIDNNSSDHTAKLVEQYQCDQSINFILRYCFEPLQGAAFARQKAIREAKGNLVGFLDDDNLPAPQWIAEAVKFSQAYPKAAAFSGQIHGCFSAEPPEGFEKIKRFLAIREEGSQAMLFNPSALNLPPAASLVVRRQAWLDSVPVEPALTGKLPGLFIQGDDYEPLLYLYKAGWEIWYNPDLHTYHQIPKQRLEREYLLTLAKGCGLATCQLSLITAKGWQKPRVVASTFLGNFRRMINHLFRYRGNLKHDLAAAFEFQFYWGSLISPFYVRRWN